MRSPSPFPATHRPRTRQSQCWALATHASRVLALLRAAGDAVAGGGWAPRPADSLGLELVVTSPVPPPSDATNYLGGVGDVLEVKARRGELAHLAELASVALYDNDRQFHDVRYRWQRGRTVDYSVRIWLIEDR